MKNPLKYAPGNWHATPTLQNKPHRRTRTRMLAILFALACTVQAHSALAFNRFVDSTGGNDSSNCLNSASPCRTIAFAIGNSIPNDQIVLMSLAGTPNVYNESGILIPFNLVIRGVNAFRSVIDGGAIDRIFTVNGGNLLLNRVTLRNGNATPLAGGSGGAVQLVNGSLTVLSSILRDNVALQGGAIEAGNTAGPVRIFASQVHHNRSTASGGAIHCNGCGGIRTQTSHFFKNLAGSQGGAVFIQSAPMSTLFTRFGVNHANDGGAIFANSSQLAIHDSELLDNEANQGDGGAIFSAGSLSIQRSTIAGNSATENGGGVFVFGDVDLNTSNSTYSRNTAIAGGALSLVGNFPSPGPAAHVSNSTFVDNESSFGGQGHHISGAWSFLRVDNSILHLSPALQATNDACTAPVTNGAGNLIGDSSCNTGSAVFNFGAVSGLNTALSFNGGFSRTHAINAASNAVDSSFSGLCINTQTGNPLTVDQRRQPRPVDGDLDTVAVCDIGAFELQ